MDNGREQRGLMIAATVRIGHNKGGCWRVPSQTDSGVIYSVDLAGNSPTCTCPDYSTRQERCKHIYAVEFSLRRETRPDFCWDIARAAIGGSVVAIGIALELWFSSRSAKAERKIRDWYAIRVRELNLLIEQERIKRIELAKPPKAESSTGSASFHYYLTSHWAGFTRFPS